jgi:hypothetical protein
MIRTIVGCCLRARAGPGWLAGQGHLDSVGGQPAHVIEVPDSHAEVLKGVTFETRMPLELIGELLLELHVENTLGGSTKLASYHAAIEDLAGPHGTARSGSRDSATRPGLNEPQWCKLVLNSPNGGFGGRVLLNAEVVAGAREPAGASVEPPPAREFDVDKAAMGRWVKWPETKPFKLESSRRRRRDPAPSSPWHRTR